MRISFDDFVTEVEKLARAHTGQARETVLAAFGQPRIDRVDREWLDDALRRVHTAADGSAGQRHVARTWLAQALTTIEARSKRVAL